MGGGRTWACACVCVRATSQRALDGGGKGKKRIQRSRAAEPPYAILNYVDLRRAGLAEGTSERGDDLPLSHLHACTHAHTHNTLFVSKQTANAINADPCFFSSHLFFHLLSQ